MATLVVEDGTGLANANVYLSVADADTYHADRGNSAWAALTTAQKQAGLLYATTQIDVSYSWKGYLADPDQALEWPRLSSDDTEGRVTDNEVPDKIKQATAELALLHQTSALNATYSRGGRVKRQKVGIIEREFFEDAPEGVTTPFIDKLVANFITTGSTSTREITRA